ncbi:MAG: hypothetical protein ACW964_03120, partial [Candidatus Hodarchaeales archaeon]
NRINELSLQKEKGFYCFRSNFDKILNRQKIIFMKNLRNNKNGNLNPTKKQYQVNQQLRVI